MFVLYQPFVLNTFVFSFILTVADKIMHTKGSRCPGFVGGTGILPKLWEQIKESSADFQKGIDQLSE